MSVYPFIEAEKAQQRNVKRTCELLEVSRAAYYANRADSPSTRQLVDQELTEHIRAAHQASKGRYGAPRIHAALRRAGHHHGRKRVARLMRCAELRGRALAALRDGAPMTLTALALVAVWVIRLGVKPVQQWNFNCVGCHAHGGGGMGPALMDSKWIYGSQPQQIFATIVEGRPNGMPSFRGKIPDYEVWQLVAFVRSVGGLGTSGGSPGRSDEMSAAPPPSSMPAQTPQSAQVPPP